jgi:hypothetical protein
MNIVSRIKCALMSREWRFVSLISDLHNALGFCQRLDQEPKARCIYCLCAAGAIFFSQALYHITFTV